MAQVVVQAQGITKSYGSLQVLKGVDFSLYQGEVVSITGPSGAGKSTLLHIAGTLDSPDEGCILIQGQHMASLPVSQLSKFRNKHIGFIFQFHHLLPEFTALENVCIPAWVAQQTKADATTKARELLELMGLANRIDHKPAQLSGGEQQRVAVARALINNPLVVFADEPSGNLDTHHAREMHELFFRLRNQLNQTFLIVTHNEDLAAMSDRKLMMRDGLMVSDA